MKLDEKLRIDMCKEYLDLERMISDLRLIILCPGSEISEEDIIEHNEKTNLLVKRLLELNNIMRNHS